MTPVQSPKNTKTAPRELRGAVSISSQSGDVIITNRKDLEADFKRSLADYILFYNTTRAHAYLSYKSPDEYEDLYFKKNDN